MATFRPFPPNGTDPWGTPLRAWATDVEVAIADVEATASAAVPNTPEGRTALAGSTELSDAFAVSGGAEGFVAKDDMRASGLVIAWAGDSTSDEISESAWRGVAQWVAERPEITATSYYGFGESGPYTQAGIQTGAGGAWSNYYDDTFTRTGELLGSTPDKGAAYSGNAGGWTADGTAAVASGTGASIIQETTSGGAGGRRRVVASCVMDTTPGANEKVLSISIGVNSSNQIRLRIGISTAGVQTWVIQKIIGGTVTTIATGSGNPFTANAVNTFDASLELDGSTGVTVKVGALTVAGTLTSGDVTAAVDGAFRIYFLAGGSASAGTTKIDRLRADVWASSTRTLTFYNGSRAGSVAQYAIDRMAYLYPVPVDVLFVNYGHNYGAGTPADFIAAIDALCTAFKASHPEAGIVICSQNPEFAPASRVNEHRARQAALRRYARLKGYGYLPIFELYASQGDGGQSWVQTDGIHPKRSTEAADPANGAYQGAVAIRKYLDALSLRTP